MISFGSAAFWIALAAVIISGRWLQARRAALKYDTIVRLAEKTGRIDEEQFKLLFPPPHPLPPHWFAPPPRGNGRTALRVFGTILMATGAGLVVLLFALQGYFNAPPAERIATDILGAAIVFVFLGAGLFSAMFAPVSPVPLLLPTSVPTAAHGQIIDR